MDLATTLGVVVAGTVIINFIWNVVLKITKSDDVRNLMKFKTQTELWITQIQEEVNENKNSTSRKFEAIMSEMRGMRTDISGVKVDVSKIVGAWEVIRNWIGNGKRD